MVLLGERFRDGATPDFDKAQDYEEALKHYRMAANLGEPTAMLCIALIYRNGWGVAQNDAEALSWLRKAAEHGNEVAKRILSGQQ